MSGAWTGAAQTTAGAVLAKLAGSAFNNIRTSNTAKRNNVLFDHPLSIMRQAYSDKYYSLLGTAKRSSMGIKDIIMNNIK